MRKVMVYKWGASVSLANKPVRDEREVAVFHDFNTDYEEIGCNVGQYPVAIVEFRDGSVESVPLALIRFIE